MSEPFAHLSRDRVRRILNVLTESTFFYSEDERDLFHYLRRHQEEFRRFFDEKFGWDLYLDARMARLIKREIVNLALPLRSRDIFDLTRRDECLHFVLLLEFYEREAQRQNVGRESDQNLRFVLSDYVEFAVTRFREELGERAPADREIFESARPLLQKLERYRFLRKVEREAPSADESLPDGMEEQVLCEFLPGIRCYDPAALAGEILKRGVPDAPA